MKHLALIAALMLLLLKVNAQLCAVPTNPTTTNLCADSVRLNWTSTGTKFEVRVSAQNPVSWKSMITTTTTRLIDTLIAGNYMFQVRNMCTLQNSAWSDTIKFTIPPACVVPAAPVLSEPIYYNYNFTSSSPKDARYSTINPVTWIKTQGNGYPWTDTRSIPISDLAYDRDYMIQNRNVCSPGDTSNYSDTTFFHSSCLKRLSTHFVEERGDSMYIAWQGSGKVKWILMNNGIALDSGTTTQQGVWISGLSKQYYYVYVKSDCGPENFMPDTASHYMTIACPSPDSVWATFQEGDQYEIRWANSAPKYQIRYKLRSAASWTNVFLTNTNFYWVNAPYLDTNYVVQVRSICNPGDTSVWSSELDFHTSCYKFNSVKVLEQSGDSVKIGWTSVGEVEWFSGKEYAYSNSDSGKTSDQYVWLHGFHGQQYYFFIKSNCTNPHQEWYDTVYYKVSVPCAAPDSIWVLNAHNDNYVVNWNPSGPAYQMRYSKTDLIDWYYKNTSNTQATIYTLENNEDFIVQVRTICGPGDSSAWSDTIPMHTVCFQHYSTHIAQQNGDSVNVAWTGYGEVSWELIADNVVLNNGVTTFNNVWLYDLPTNNYTFYLYSHCGGNPADKDTLVFSVTSSSACPVPTNIHHSYDGDTVQFTWNGYAPKYEFRIVADPDTVWKYEITSNKFTASDTLQEGMSYTMAFRAICGVGDTSDWSIDWHLFLTKPACPLPQNLHIDYSIIDTVLFKWDGTAPSYSYALVEEGSGDTVHSGNTTQKEIGFDYLKEGAYTMFVRSLCADGRISDPDSLYFYHAGCPDPFNPYHMVTSDSAYLIWSNFSQDATFDVRIMKLPENTWSYETVSATYILKTGLQPGTYYWSVRTNCKYGEHSNWSDSLQFTIQEPAPCNAPDSIWRYYYSGNVYAITWNDVATKYQVRWKLKDQQTWSLGPVQSYRLYNVYTDSLDADYIVEIRSICAPGDTSNWSNDFEFHSSCYKPYSVHEVERSGDSIRFEWESVGMVEWIYKESNGGIQDSGQTTLNYTWVKATEGTDYWFLIKGICVGQAEQAPDTVYGRNYPCQPANLIGTTIQGDSVRFQWSFSAFKFILSIRNLNTGVLSSQEVTGSYIWLSGFADSTTYSWSVRCICDNGMQSAESDSALFYIGGQSNSNCPQPQKKYCYPEGDGARVNWSDVSASQYQVYANEIGTGTEGYYYTTETTFFVAGLTPGANYEFKVRAICNQTDTSEWSDTSMVRTYTLEGINGNVVNEEVSIYPNPSHGAVKITSTFDLNTIEVYEINGRLVLSEKGSGKEFRLDLPLAKGLYIIKAKGEVQERNLRLIRD